MQESSKNYLFNKLNLTYGETLTERIMAGFSSRRRSSFRVNTQKATRDEVLAALDGANIAFAPVSWYEDAFIIDDEEAVRALPLYEEGKVYFQSLSSMLPPLFLRGEIGKNVLDMAAAPGGKTSELFNLSGGTSAITACEKNPARAEKLKFNLARQGVTKANVMVTDAATLSDFFSFDTVLLDTPCSGSGTVDLNVTASKAEFSDKNMAWLKKTQTALINKAVKVLKKGNTMVYSTCSLFKEENEEIVKIALKNGCVLVPIEAPDGVPLLPSMDGTLTVCPNEFFEGFFIAKLKKA